MRSYIHTPSVQVPYLIREHTRLAITLYRPAGKAFRISFERLTSEACGCQWSHPCAATSCPSSIMRRITSGAFSAKLLVQKKVAFTPFFSGSPVSCSYHRLTLSLLHPAESLHHAREVHQILLYQNLIISLQYQELQLLHIMQTFIVTV